MCIVIFFVSLIWAILGYFGIVPLPSSESHEKSYTQKDMEKYWWIYEQWDKGQHGKK